MPEPTASTVAAVSLSAGGLTIFGIATGLHPMLLLAGLAGGWWALSYQAEPMPLLRRVTALSISALSAGWITPPAVAATVSAGWLGPQTTGELLQFPGALIVGLLAHAAIGPALMKFTTKKIEGAA
jgi:hypothetical protein